MKKFMVAGIMACVMMVASVMPAFAAWEGSDAAGWKWKKDDGSYVVGQWEWIDDNADNIFESYYFDANGICALDAQIGEYFVNKLGQWVVGDVVQKKAGNNGPGGTDKKAVEKEKRQSTALDAYASQLKYTGVDGTEVAKISTDGDMKIFFDVTIPQPASAVSTQAIADKYYGDAHYKVMQVMANDALKYYGASREIVENIYSSDGQLLYNYTYYGRPSLK